MEVILNAPIFNALPTEYEQRLFKKWPIDHSNYNIVERFKVSLIKLFFDNWMYVSNPQNVDFDDLPFYDDQMLITRRQIYSVNDDIIERLINGSIVEGYRNRM